MSVAIDNTLSTQGYNFLDIDQEGDAGLAAENLYNMMQSYDSSYADANGDGVTNNADKAWIEQSIDLDGDGIINDQEAAEIGSNFDMGVDLNEGETYGWKSKSLLKLIEKGTGSFAQPESKEMSTVITNTISKFKKTLGTNSNSADFTIGNIRNDDVKAMAEKYGSVDDPGFQKELTAHFDKNGDGVLNENEADAIFDAFFKAENYSLDTVANSYNFKSDSSAADFLVADFNKDGLIDDDFRTVDTDGDGKMSGKEAVAYLNEFQESYLNGGDFMMDGELNAFDFAMPDLGHDNNGRGFDKNKDGVVTKEEVAAMDLSQNARMNETTVESFMKANDANDDGQIDIYDIKNNQLDEFILRTADQNQDGRITVDEFEALAKMDNIKMQDGKIDEDEQELIDSMDDKAKATMAAQITGSDVFKHYNDTVGSDLLTNNYLDTFMPETRNDKVSGAVNTEVNLDWAVYQNSIFADGYNPSAILPGGTDQDGNVYNYNFRGFWSPNPEDWYRG